VCAGPGALLEPGHPGGARDRHRLLCVSDELDADKVCLFGRDGTAEAVDELSGGSDRCESEREGED